MTWFYDYKDLNIYPSSPPSLSSFSTYTMSDEERSPSPVGRNRSESPSAVEEVKREKSGGRKRVSLPSSRIRDKELIAIQPRVADPDGKIDLLNDEISS